jgi:hypothetical protein
MMKRIRIALAALALAFAIAFNAGSLASFSGGFAGNTVVALTAVNGEFNLNTRK